MSPLPIRVRGTSGPLNQLVCVACYDASPLMGMPTQLFDAATVLSDLLTQANITHAFAGNFETVALGGPGRDTEEILCIVMSGFRHVREAIQAGDQETMSVNMAGWANRMFVKYHEPIPAVEIEICVAGEVGPRNLNPQTVMAVQGLPFLSVTEFMRAKLRVWAARNNDADAQDVLFILNRYWGSIDLNRIPEADMDRLVTVYPAAEAPWNAVKQRYDQ
ncbi:hypothetical protein FRC07_007623 [Ceratobasidium sp. 392]|nr:hypothetical protein FRC07_007623 [Ceratobasidium sp. 392]